eukprot:TRINITY_DN4665_c0_g1_i3.p1 TRINITY_DN4665_c0_g1~~TRINITY_DN4665_c0_g1_i3.p1  ORF type:complete len:501 (-),score=41.77 TRINITY_DN4665_c0_g1_i3:76-1578(-)
MQKEGAVGLRVVVLGGGISGLSAAYFAARHPAVKSVTLLEGTGRFGGWLQTAYLPSPSAPHTNYQFECGPASLRTTGAPAAVTLQLMDDIGLLDSGVAIGGSPAGAKRRYLYTDGQLQELPSSLLGLAVSPLGRRIMQSALHEIWVKRPSQDADESVHRFFARRFSPYVADVVADPLVSGIFAGRAKEVSLRGCFPSLHQYEKKYGSVVRGVIREMFTGSSAERPVLSPKAQDLVRQRIASFTTGMQALPDALVSWLSRVDNKPVNLRLNTAAACIAMTADRKEGYEIQTQTGEIIAADRIISTLPARSLSKLLAASDVEDFHANQQLVTMLASIAHSSVAVVHLGYPNLVLPPGVEGFGYLVPSSEREPILGVQWNSLTFPQHNSRPTETRLTVMLRIPDLPLTSGGAVSETETYRQVAEASVQRHLGFDQPAEVAHVVLNRHAIPQYGLGHATLAQEIIGLTQQVYECRLGLVSGFLHGVAINDCVVNAQRTVNSLVF